MTYQSDLAAIDAATYYPKKVQQVRAVIEAQLKEAARAGRDFITPALRELARLADCSPKHAGRAVAQLTRDGVLAKSKRCRFVDGVPLRCSNRIYRPEPKPAEPFQQIPFRWRSRRWHALSLATALTGRALDYVQRRRAVLAGAYEAGRPVTASRDIFGPATSPLPTSIVDNNEDGRQQVEAAPPLTTVGGVTVSPALLRSRLLRS